MLGDNLIVGCSMTEREKQLLRDLRKVFIKYPDISQNNYDRLEIPRPARTTLRRTFKLSWQELKEKALEGYTVSTEETVEENTEDSPSASRDYLRAQNDRLMRELDKQRNLTQVFVDNCLAEIQKLNIKAVPIPKAEKGKGKSQYHGMRSDAQVGEKTESQLVQGLSGYNCQKYEKRVDQWSDKVITFREYDYKSHGLNQLVLHWLGDQVEGEQIYEGQPFYLDASLTEQLFFSVEVEVRNILRLAQVFPQVEIFMVWGNHGRPGRKGQNHVKTNFDYIFYRVLKMALIQQQNVSVYISECPSMLVDHGKFRFLLNHGDNIKSWGGIPYYGLERMSRRVHDLFGMTVDYQLLGHHHQATNLSDRILMNGCLPGGSTFSINQMWLTSLPSQKIFYLDPEHGIHHESNLYLDDVQKLTPDERGVYTAWV